MKQDIAAPLINSNLDFNPEGLKAQTIKIICDDGAATWLLRVVEKGEKTDL